MTLGGEFAGVLEAAQTGVDEAFARLYRGLNPALSRYLSARAPGAADDLAAETWLAAARQLATFRGEEAGFRGWLFTIARRRLVQHWRDERRRPSQPTDPESLAEHPGADDAEAPAIGALSAREAAQVIARALPPDQADVVLLRLVAGLDVDEVASVLGKRPGTVRVLQHKAVRRLARRFSVDALTL
jgi:RNA polymerase sigma-70 factor (ECF subfamily)